MNPASNDPKRSTRKIAPPAFDASLMGEAPVGRRGFLGLFGLGALAATLPAPAARSVNTLLFRGNPLMLDKVTHDIFATHLGGKFQLELAPGSSVEAQLLEVNPLAGNRLPTGAERRRPFSLLLRLPPGIRVAQSVYPLDHPQLGRLDIFLVPVRQDAEGLVLEAIFN
jgi:hypothetical protein